MKRNIFIMVMVLTLCMMITACGGGKESTDYEHLREVSWEGDELTIKLGENKSTGCEWTTKPQDDKVIDYSVNRSFKLAGDQTLRGKAIGTLSAGFKGKGAGTSQIVCTTPVGWEGTGDGLTYIVTVTVNEDGTIKDAKGEESASKPAEEPEQTEQSEVTLESYFKDHPDELKEVKKSLKEDESYNKVVDIDVDVKENTLSYIYTFKETYSDEKVKELKPDLEKSIEQAGTQLKDQIKSIEDSYGVKGVKMYMEFRNGDGSKICGGTV